MFHYSAPQYSDEYEIDHEIAMLRRRRRSCTTLMYPLSLFHQSLLTFHPSVSLLNFMHVARLSGESEPHKLVSRYVSGGGTGGGA